MFGSATCHLTSLVGSYLSSTVFLSHPQHTKHMHACTDIFSDYAHKKEMKINSTKLDFSKNMIQNIMVLYESFKPDLITLVTGLQKPASQ